ncbi:MAG: DNA-deoxyinosine glycosylase [Chitinophagales bacterium]
MTKCSGFPPIIGNKPKVLILGSMPGRQSIEEQRYYANPRNQFWNIIFAVIDVSCPTDYSQRLKCLKKAGIAVWDVLATCEREGSLDSHIREPEPNDFSGLFKQHPSIKLVVFNGTKATALGKKLVRQSAPEGTVIKTMPSTSPVPAREVKTVDDKIQEWLIIREYL